MREISAFHSNTNMSAIRNLLAKGSAASGDTHRSLGQVANKEVSVAEIKYHEGPLMVPNGMSIQEAVEVLKSRLEYDSTTVNITETFNVFPWDGAHALDCVPKKPGVAVAAVKP